MRKITFITLILSNILLLLSGCHRPDSRLTRVDALADSVPEVAVDSLRAICRDSLPTDADREYYDFLLLKTSDKTFVHHSSDTLALRIVANEERHKRRGRYPEALYLAGRVYHDLGDYPTALNYYQSALDELPDKPQFLKHKACILSQTCVILNNLRLYERAIYCLEEAMGIDVLQNDSLNLMFDTGLMGAINLHAEKLDSAELYLKRAKRLALKLSASDTSIYNMRLAAVKYKKGQIDSAINLIGSSVFKIDSLFKDDALGYACKIYHKAGKKDSALIFAKQLLNAPGSFKRLSAYQTILAEDMRNYTVSDSLIKLVFAFRALTDSLLNENGNQAALMQNTYYNYQFHLKQRLETEKKNNKLLIWIILSSCAVLVLTIVVIFLKYKNKIQQLKLHETIGKVKRLREDFELSETEKSTVLSKTIQKFNKDDSVHNSKDLREYLRREIIALSGNLDSKINSGLPTAIAVSDTYKEIKKRIREERPISPPKLYLGRTSILSI